MRPTTITVLPRQRHNYCVNSRNYIIITLQFSWPALNARSNIPCSISCLNRGSQTCINVLMNALSLIKLCGKSLILPNFTLRKNTFTLGHGEAFDRILASTSTKPVSQFQIISFTKKLDPHDGIWTICFGSVWKISLLLSRFMLQKA